MLLESKDLREAISFFYPPSPSVILSEVEGSPRSDFFYPLLPALLRTRKGDERERK